MKINYRVLSYSNEDHTMTVRYWTDIISEDDIASSFDEYNRIIYDLNGHPVRTRSDVNITFTNPNPSAVEVMNKISISSPSMWLYNMEQNRLTNTQYSLENVAPFVGVSNSFNVMLSSNGSVLTQNTSPRSLKEDAAKIAIRYIKTGVYDLGNTDTYVI